MFFAFRNHFQVFCRKINWGQLESGLRAQHKRESFALWQIVKIQTLTWNGWSERHIPFRRFVLCWSGPAVRPQIIDADGHPFSASNILHNNWTASAHESRLRSDGSLSRFI